MGPEGFSKTDTASASYKEAKALKERFERGYIKPNSILEGKED